VAFWGFSNFLAQLEWPCNAFSSYEDLEYLGPFAYAGLAMNQEDVSAPKASSPYNHRREEIVILSPFMDYCRRGRERLGIDGSGFPKGILNPQRSKWWHGMMDESDYWTARVICIGRADFETAVIWENSF